MHLRRLLRAGPCLLLGALATAAMAEQLRFQVYLDERPIGEHSFRIAETGDTTRVTSRAASTSTSCSSTPTATATPATRCSATAASRRSTPTTDDNGKRYEVDGEANGDAFSIRSATASSATERLRQDLRLLGRDFLDQSPAAEPADRRPGGRARAAEGPRT
jgi:hypothetical protein